MSTGEPACLPFMLLCHNSRKLTATVRIVYGSEGRGRVTVALLPEGTYEHREGSVPFGDGSAPAAHSKDLCSLVASSGGKDSGFTQFCFC